MQNMPSILTPDFGLFFWMLIAFLFVFFVLKKFGFAVIIKAVEERKDFIDQSLKNAREANEKLARIKTESENILKAAREQQAQIIKDAKLTQDKIVTEAHSKAALEGKNLLEEAKRQIEIEKEKALSDIRTQVADLSLQIAEKVIQRELQKDGEQEHYIERLLNEMTH